MATPAWAAARLGRQLGLPATRAPRASRRRTSSRPGRASCRTRRAAAPPARSREAQRRAGSGAPVQRRSGARSASRSSWLPASTWTSHGSARRAGSADARRTSSGAPCSASVAAAERPRRAAASSRTGPQPDRRPRAPAAELAVARAGVDVQVAELRPAGSRGRGPRYRPREMGYNGAMPTYIMLSTLTPEGVQTVKNNPQRIREVNKEVEQLGAIGQGAVGDARAVRLRQRRRGARRERRWRASRSSSGSRGTSRYETLVAIPIDDFIATL